jgi:hypothetical protein|tara:strand:- start:604 stop:786 length:183 start_codon:yes stop_codon:yes gene_type:complete
MRWQSRHQKAKNSTSCGFPAASTTVDGSVGCMATHTVAIGGASAGALCAALLNGAQAEVN